MARAPKRKRKASAKRAAAKSRWQHEMALKPVEPSELYTPDEFIKRLRQKQAEQRHQHTPT